MNATSFAPVQKKPTNSYAVNRFETYYNGPLASNIHWPKPCAYKGAVLSPVTYYRGQGQADYSVWQDNDSANVLTGMGADAEWLLIDGKSADKLGKFIYSDYRIHFNGDSTDSVGNYTTVIRDCNAFGRLLELSLAISVLPNQSPQFRTQPKVSWLMELGTVETYKLPVAYDPDQNAIGVEVYLEATPQYPDKYPPFLTYDNATQTLTFKPDTIWVRGRTYYFTVVVKEKASSAKTEYKATCKVLGKPTTDIKYYLRDLVQPDPLKPLQGKLFFDHSIDV